MTFEATQGQAVQEHFYIVEIDLPIITGKCEISDGVEGFGTPNTCPIQDGTSASEIKTYKFCTTNAPLIPNETVYRCLLTGGIKESATELQSGKGLAIRGRATISFQNFPNVDPNEERASGLAVANQGTFFGKYVARNIFENKATRIKKYRKAPNVNLATDALTTEYVGQGMKRNQNTTYTLDCVDELSRVDFGKTQLPPAQNGSLRAGINATTKTIPVNESSIWTFFPVPYVVKIGEELITVDGVTDPNGTNTVLSVQNRGNTIGGDSDFNNVLSTGNVNEPHDNDDEVFVCFPADGMNIADFLERSLFYANVDTATYVPLQDWYDEMDLWHPNSKIVDLLVDARDTDKVIESVLEAYMLDMWFDPIDREIKLKAISNWQESSAIMRDGLEITSQSLSYKAQEPLRFSRAFIIYNKPRKVDDDDDNNFTKGAFGIRPEIETDDFYGKQKTKRFANNTSIDKTGADLLVQRFVQRYGTMPFRYSWATMEKYLTFKTGDIVEINSVDAESFDGLPANNLRAQIIRIQPQDTKFGREYKVDALTYQPANIQGDGSTLPFTITGGNELNLYVVAGAPPNAVNVTFIFDGDDYTSGNNTVPAVKAGAFSVGSVITIILRNGANWQSKGGNAGAGVGADGLDGGVVYDAMGVTTNIYLSGSDPLGDTANGFLRAAGGGGGGGMNDDTGGGEPELISGGGGGGGAGNDIGDGGSSPNYSGGAGTGTSGSNGDENGNGGTGGAGALSAGDGGDGGDWGENGQNGGSSPLGAGGDGGLAGKGIITGGGLVTLFGDTPTNFINGGGDTPSLRDFNNDFNDDFIKG